MLFEILSDVVVSISELKKNPSAVIKAAEGAPVAVLNRNKPIAYLVPAAAWGSIMEQLEDTKLVEIVKARQGEAGVEVSLDDL